MAKNGAKVEIQKSKTVISREALFNISSENIEKCREWNFFSDCNWVKVANWEMADFVHPFSVFAIKFTFK